MNFCYEVLFLSFKNQRATVMRPPYGRGAVALLLGLIMVTFASKIEIFRKGGLSCNSPLYGEKYIVCGMVLLCYNLFII